jgi:NitT/TauT family transport system permease protein
VSNAIKYLLPIAVGIFVLTLWEVLVRAYHVPVFVLPPPSAIWEAFVDNFPSLIAAFWSTFRTMAVAFALILVSGISLAVLFSQSRSVENALYPYAIILQVTPVVSIAPVILIWVGMDHVNVALVLIALIVGFFPVLSNTTLGLKSADHNLVDLFRLYGASRWQILLKLRFPTALPNLLAGMKISGGLALVGAVVAEFVAGSGTDTGLAWLLIEASRNLEIAKMFAALALLAVLGIAIFSALSLLEWALLHRWHESAIKETN